MLISTASVKRLMLSRACVASSSTSQYEGSLFEQDPNDEPASELIARIQTEKMRLVNEGKIGTQKALPDIGDEELPFLVPSKWIWTRLAGISRRIHYGFTASAKTSLKDVRLLRITDIQNNLV